MGLFNDFTTVNICPVFFSIFSNCATKESLSHFNIMEKSQTVEKIFLKVLVRTTHVHTDFSMLNKYF